jgi:hypothetical protein
VVESRTRTVEVMSSVEQTARSVSRAIAGVVVALAVVALVAVLEALSGSAAAARAQGASDNWEVWLDAPLPHDVPPGASLHVGFIMWDVTESSTVTVFGAEVRLHPASGQGRTLRAEPKIDWPGHSVADLVVPPGGFGRLEFGIYRNAGVSGAGRTITLDFSPVPVAGVGPPPGISLRRIGTMAVDPTLPAVAGEPFDVNLAFQPRVGWPAGSISFPSTLTLDVRVPRSDDDQEVEATLVDPTAGRYRASVVVHDPGPYILEAAMRPDAPPDERFSETSARVVVDAPGAEPTSAAGPGPVGSAAPATAAARASGIPSPVAPTTPASTVSGGPSVLVLALGGLALAGALFLVGRVLRAEW